MTNPIEETFNTNLRHQIQCETCLQKFTSYESTVFGLELNITEASTIEDSLLEFFQENPLEEKSYKCPDCKVRVNATKQSAVELVPEVLCIHLKCFRNNGDKINKNVQISLNICLGSFLCDPDYLNINPNVNYKLVSAISHVGQSSRHGHYTAIGVD